MVDRYTQKICERWHQFQYSPLDLWLWAVILQMCTNIWRASRSCTCSAYTYAHTPHMHTAHVHTCTHTCACAHTTHTHTDRHTRAHAHTHACIPTTTYVNVWRLTCVQEDGSETDNSQEKNDNDQSSTEYNHSREEVSALWARHCMWWRETRPCIIYVSIRTTVKSCCIPWLQTNSFVWLHSISQLPMFCLKKQQQLSPQSAFCMVSHLKSQEWSFTSYNCMLFSYQWHTPDTNTQYTHTSPDEQQHKHSGIWLGKKLQAKGSTLLYMVTWSVRGCDDCQ